MAELKIARLLSSAKPKLAAVLGQESRKDGG